MNKLVLITGGTRSGKSSFGESILKGNDDVAYVATMEVTDDEMKERVRKHREHRNRMWTTVEGYKDLHLKIKELKEKNIMLECIGTMITNLIFDKYKDVDDLSRDEINLLEEYISTQVSLLIEEIKKNKKNAIIITNEVGFSLVSEYKLGRIFTDILGRVNQMLARECDEVYLVACGLPTRLK